MTDIPTVEQLRSDVFAILRRHDVSEQCFAEVAMVTHAFRTQPPRPDASVDGLAGELAALDCEEACLKGTPMIPIHRDTLKRILAALTTREAVVEELTHEQADKAGRAAYAAYCGMAPIDMEPDWGREGYKIEAGVWQAVARAAIRALAAKEVE